MKAEYTGPSGYQGTDIEYVSLQTANAREAELLAEIAELKKDRERLDFIIKEEVAVCVAIGSTFGVFGNETGYQRCMSFHDTPREAIDNAMKANP